MPDLCIFSIVGHEQTLCPTFGLLEPGYFKLASHYSERNPAPPCRDVFC